MATELLRREFTVEAPLASTWNAFADVADWPRWAPHIRLVTVTPPGLIGPTSTGSLSFRPIGRSRFQISSYDEGIRWEWVGNVLWLGRIFAWFYTRLMDRAIPRLQAQLASANGGG